MHHTHNSHRPAPLHHGRSTGPNGTLKSLQVLAAFSTMLASCTTNTSQNYIQPKAIPAVSSPGDILMAALKEAYSRKDAELHIKALMNDALYSKVNMNDEWLAFARKELETARSYLKRDLTPVEIEVLTKRYYNGQSLPKKIEPITNDGTADISSHANNIAPIV